MKVAIEPFKRDFTRSRLENGRSAAMGIEGTIFEAACEYGESGDDAPDLAVVDASLEAAQTAARDLVRFLDDLRREIADQAADASDCKSRG